MTKIFLDTYALIEIIKGNENYKKYLEKESVTSLFHLYEFYFALLREYGEEIAKKYFLQFKYKEISVKEDDIFLASKIKLQNIQKRLSYADCLGYSMALQRGMKFLTGDKEFEHFKDVEFAK